MLAPKVLLYCLKQKKIVLITIIDIYQQEHHFSILYLNDSRICLQL